MRWHAVAISIVALSGCKPNDASVARAGVKDWNSLTIELSRSSCYGACPSYEVKIDGDGIIMNAKPVDR